MRTLFLIIVLGVLVVYKSSAQTRVYIEPNAAVTIDTSLLIVDNIFGHGNHQTISFKQKENVDSIFYFSLENSSRNYYSATIPTEKEVDSLIDVSILYMLTQDNDSIKVIKAQKVSFGIFKGFTTIAEFKDQRVIVKLYYLNSYDKNGIRSAFFMMKHQQDSINSELSVSEVLKSFTSYSSAAIDSIKESLTSYYSVDIQNLPLKNKYQWGNTENGVMKNYHTFNRDSVPKDVLEHYASKRYTGHRTFRGKVSIEPKLEHKLKEVRVYNINGHQIFTRNKMGDLIITSTDEQNGAVTKKGAVVIVHSSGLPIEIPFTFSYLNEK